MDWPEQVSRVFGAEIAADAQSVEVTAADWHSRVLGARDDLGCTFFDWLTGVDLLPGGFEVVARFAAPRVGHTDAIMLRTTLPRHQPSVACICDVFAGAAWHERETYEMFGVDFVGHLDLRPLLLPDGFEGHPLRKDFVLASRVVKPWPGAKDPGESASDAAPGRRRTRPPGVPDSSDWRRPPIGQPDASVDTPPESGAARRPPDATGTGDRP